MKARRRRGAIPPTSPAGSARSCRGSRGTCARTAAWSSGCARACRRTRSRRPGNQLGGNKNIQYGFGRFELDADQALVIEFARPDARLWSVQWLTDPWYENPDLANHATSVSGRDAYVGPDGVVRVVVSAVGSRRAELARRRAATRVASS